MDINSDTAKKPPSYFAQKLTADPLLASRCEKVVTEIRKSTLPDIEAGEKSEQIAPSDLSVYINTRTTYF